MKTMEPASTPRLALPFAVVGLLGGWLTVRCTVGDSSTSADSSAVWILMTLTPMVSAILGEVLRTRVQRYWVLRTILLTLAAGVVNGVLVGVCIAGVAGLVFGGVFGALFSFPFLPATLLVAGAGRRSVRSSEQSLVGGVDRRGTWRAVALLLALISLGFLRGPVQLPALLFSLGGALITMWILVLDLGIHSAVQRIASLAPSMQRRTRPQPQLVATDSACVELGVGDEVFDEIARSQAPYRESDRVVSVVYGDPYQARSRVKRALVIDGVVLAIALAGLFGMLAAG